MIDYKKIISKFIKRLKKQGVFDFAQKLVKKFPKAEVYLAGGAVRDAIIGLPDEQDYDFVVRGVPAKNLEKFLTSLGKVFLVGKRFGVFKFLPKKTKLEIPLDIALPRKEHALGTGGYRDFKVQSDPNLIINEDLSRRDFTINALALRISDGQLTDEFNGLSDLKNKIIKAVGNPEERFKEDYSRMLRALRFSCQLNFEIEEKTWQAIKKLISRLNDFHNKERIISYEVIAKEFLKSFYFNPVKAFDLYDKSGAFKILMPEILKMKGCPQPGNFHSEGDVWIHTKMALEVLNSKKFKKQFGLPRETTRQNGEFPRSGVSLGKEKPSIESIIGILFHDIGKPYTIKTPEKDGTDRIRFNEHDDVGAKLTLKICERLKLSSVADFKFDPERAAWLVKSHLLFLHGEVEEMKNSTIERYFFNPKFNGQDLLKLAFCDGKASIPQKGKSDLTTFYQMIKRIKVLEKLGKEKSKLPKSILDGHEIMKKFSLKPGQQIGELLKVLREEQLAKRVKNKKEGFEFLKEYLKK